jgi:hypothetical protein
MLPASYQTPAALVLLASGFVACFFGHRLFRLVLALFGFIIGALAVSSVMGSSSSTTMLVGAIGGGLAGAAVLTAAYFIGVALVGAALGATIANLVFAVQGHDPGVLVVVLSSIAGAVLSMYLQRYVVIVGTAFAGAWTLIAGGMGLAGSHLARTAAAAGTVWVAYPLNPAPGHRWVQFAWIALGLAGCAVQVGWTGGSKGRVAGRKKK